MSDACDVRLSVRWYRGDDGSFVRRITIAGRITAAVPTGTPAPRSPLIATARAGALATTLFFVVRAPLLAMCRLGGRHDVFVSPAEQEGIR